VTDPVRDGYDAVAEDYAERVAGELAGKPLDRALLSAFVETVRAVGPDGVIAEVGCGAGHLAAYLARTARACSGSTCRRRWLRWPDGAHRSCRSPSAPCSTSTWPMPRYVSK